MRSLHQEFQRSKMLLEKIIIREQLKKEMTQAVWDEYYQLVVEMKVAFILYYIISGCQKIVGRRCE